jgi:sulfur dioxygenase
MYFRMLHEAGSGRMSYLLADLAVGEAVLVDPRPADVPLLQAMLGEHQLRLRWLLRTHEHDALQPQGQRAAAQALAALRAPCVQHRVPEPALLDFGHEVVRVLPTPGHTGHCLSFLWRDRLFCGGLLSVDTCPDQPRPADPEALWDSVTRQVFTLPDETLVFTGHARRGRAVSTVFEQRRWHPHFAGAGRDTFLARMAALPVRAPSTATH